MRPTPFAWRWRRLLSSSCRKHCRPSRQCLALEKRNSIIPSNLISTTVKSPTDMFALHSHRIGAKVPLTLKRLLQLATLDGAVDLGLADRTGSITPGKRADLVLVRTTDINMAPAGDPYEAIVSLGLPTNVDTVIVDGRILRRAGKFTAFDQAKIVAEAREAAIGLRDKAKWPT